MSESGSQRRALSVSPGEWLTGSHNATASLWWLPTRPADGEENALYFFIKLISERKKEELFGELGMQALLREFQRGEASLSTSPPSGSLLRGWLARKKCCLGFQDVYVAGPSSPDGRPCSVLAKKSQELCGLCFREAVVCNWETSHWPMGGQCHNRTSPCF